MRLDHLLSKEYFLFVFESGWTHATSAAGNGHRFRGHHKDPSCPVRGGWYVSALSGVWHDTAHTRAWLWCWWFVCGTVTPVGTSGPDAWLSLCVVCENWRVDASILFFLLLFEFFAFLVIRFVFV